MAKTKRRRRHYGDGSIYQRKDGRWVACLRVQDPSGRVKKVYRYRKTADDARLAMREMMRHAEDGYELTQGDPTLAKYLARWLESSVKPSCRHKTYTGYVSIVEHRVVPRLGKIKLSKVTPALIQGLYADLAGGGLSPRSIINTHAVLRRALNQAVKWGMLPRNPCNAVDVPRAERPELQTLSREQVDLFLDHTGDDRFHALYVLAVTTGMRLGELLGLHWQDLDLDHARLRVRRSLQHHKGRGYVFVEPKTKRSRRTVMLSQRAVGALREHRRKQIEERLAFEGEWENPDLVFSNSWGGPLDGGWMTTRYKGILEDAGLPVIRFHDLRHTAATLLLEEGTHPKVVSDMLGHATISLTLDTYSHVIPTLHQEAANVMDRLFGGA